MTPLWPFGRSHLTGNRYPQATTKIETTLSVSSTFTFSLCLRDSVSKPQS